MQLNTGTFLFNGSGTDDSGYQIHQIYNDMSSKERWLLQTRVIGSEWEAGVKNRPSVKKRRV
jgi:hypothetical protein